MSKDYILIPSESNLAIEHRTLDNSTEDVTSCIARTVLKDPNDDFLNVIPTILVRQPVRLLAFHHPQTTEGPNIRATSLCMACGHFNMRLKGRVVLTLSEDDDMFLPAIIAATQGCDLRQCCRREPVSSSGMVARGLSKHVS